MPLVSRGGINDMGSSFRIDINQLDVKRRFICENW
jgi:hypothetical protein